jgi:hypothetical protein
MSIIPTFVDKFASDEAAESENAKVDAGQRLGSKRTRSHVQFDAAPPETISRSLGTGNNPNRSDSQVFQDPSVADKSSQRSRLIKLILTLALPTFVVFAQVQTV